MKEVTLAYGLNLLLLGKIKKLYSDGLESNEYIYCDKGRFYYEDDCMIGNSYFNTLTTLLMLEWSLRYHFFVKETYTEDKSREYKFYEKEVAENGYFSLGEYNHKIIGVKNNKYVVVEDGEEKVLGTNLKEALG